MTVGGFKGVWIEKGRLKLEFLGKKAHKMQNNFNGMLFYCRNKLSVLDGYDRKSDSLGIMLIGIICLLIALWIYNCPFAENEENESNYMDEIE